LKRAWRKPAGEINAALPLLAQTNGNLFLQALPGGSPQPLYQLLFSKAVRAQVKIFQKAY